jgi:hypothetical protein
LFLVVLAVIVIGFPVLISGDTAMPTREANIPNRDVAGDILETANSPASAATTIATTGILGE